MRLLLAVGVLIILGRGASLAACVGDCDGDGGVAVDELIAAVGITLGQAGGKSCEAIDPDGDGRILLESLIRAVASAVDRCPPETTPSPTPTSSATRTSSATASVTESVGTTVTPPPTITPTPTATGSSTATPTGSATPTATDTATPLRIPTSAESFRDVALGTQAALRVAVSTFGHLTLLHDAAGLAAGECSAGGSASSTCREEGGIATRSVFYSDCQATTAGGNTLTRNGTVIETIDDCSSEDPPQRVELSGFRAEESNGPATFLSLEADLRVEVATLGRQGCAGPNIEETFDGTIDVICSAGAQSIACPAGGLDAFLRATALREERVSVDVPCRRLTTATGAVRLSNRQSKEDLTQIFDGLVVSIVPDAIEPGDGDVLTINGRMSVDCLGMIEIMTVRPLRVAPGASCPSDGELAFKRSDGESPPQLRDSVAAANLETPGAGFRQFLFRAAGGQVYQVIQNDDAANGADAIQLTTMAGSLGESVAACSMTVGGGQSNPIAAAVTAAGEIFPLEDAERSSLIADVTLPRFNRNAENGAGRVCIGAGCTADSSCPDGASCETFVLGDEGGLAKSDPPARVAAVATTCGTFNGGREAYAFGVGGPTIERALCAAPPTDGLRLPLGNTLVVAYDSQPLEIFNAGAAGLPIDLDGQNSLCPSPGVLSPGRAVSDTAAVPRIEFRAAQGAVADYDGDRGEDRVFPDCGVPVRIECSEPDDPTPTPTADPSRPCGATVLESVSEIDRLGSTAGRPNSVGGSSCGWGGGNGASDQVYEYVVPAAGMYDIRVEATDFAPLLSILPESCLPRLGETCNEDADGDGAAAVSLELVEGQRIAIVVDGDDERSGGFRLRLKRREPDLIVLSLSANPTAANAGEAVTVSATVRNQGDGAAGPFDVDFFLATDGAGTGVVSVAPLRCPVATGLGAGQATTCLAPNDFTLPLISEGQYFLVAKVDGREAVQESREDNNVGSIPFALGPAPGAVLEQHVFRAFDGTVYQLIQAVPRLAGQGGSGRHRITSLAASSSSVRSCESGLGPTSGSALVGVAGTGPSGIFGLSGIQRTGILRPNSLGAPRFDRIDGGRLLLGAGDATIQVCVRAEHCSGASRFALTSDGGSIPKACLARRGSSYCASQEINEVIAFGLAESGGECSNPDQVSSATSTCFGAAPLRGFDLRPGEAVVFLHEPGREAFEVGAGSFGLAADKANPPGCSPGQVIEGAAVRESQGRLPLLRFVEALKRTSPTATALSPDGRHLYVATTGSVAAFAINGPSGTPVLVEVESEGEGGVDGLNDTTSIALSPDGRHVYVTSAFPEDSLVVFERREESGALSFVEVLREGVGGASGLDGARAVVVSPDGLHVYVASSLAIGIFSRDGVSGVLSFVEIEAGGTHALAISEDGTRVYAATAGFEAGSVRIFSRDATSGGLSLLETQTDGVGGVSGLVGAKAIALSPDGRHLYVAASDDQPTLTGTVAFFSLEKDGTLDFEDEVRAGADNAEGFAGATSIAVSPGGAHVYVTSSRNSQGAGDDAVALFARDSATGRLGFIQVQSEEVDGIDGLGGATSVSIANDGGRVYIASRADKALVTFARTSVTGHLMPLDIERAGVGGVDGLDGARSAAVSPDGKHVYVAGLNDDAVAAFARSESDGTLTSVGVRRDGMDGIDSLDGASSVVVSPDGQGVYVASSEDDSLTSFRRNTDSGELNPVGVLSDGVGGVDGLLGARSAALSLDGEHAYVAATFDSSVTLFDRIPSSGTVNFVETQKCQFDFQLGRCISVDGLDGARFVTVSPDGLNVYVGGFSTFPIPDNGTVAVFVRDMASGALSSRQVLRYSLSGPQVAGATSAAVSPDGANVYVASSTEAVLAVFARNGSDGTLGSGQILRDGLSGIDGLFGASGVTVSPDGRYVLVASTIDDAVVVFSRNQGSGSLTLLEVLRDGVDGVDGIDGAFFVTVSPDGRNAYACSSGDNGIAVFAFSE